MDAYSYCPGGCAKKIKFCCGAEVIPDLEKLSRMLEGEQRRACLDHIAKMPAKLRDRPCVLLKKAAAHTMAEEEAAAEAVYREMLEKYPDNVAAQAFVAPLEIAAGRVREGIELLQSAIDASLANEEAPTNSAVFFGIFMSGQRLLGDHTWAARAHLRLADLLAAKSGAGEMLDTMDHQPRLPLVWKDDPNIPAAPADAPFKAEYEEAETLVVRGQWRQAAAFYAALAERYPASPVPWKALAAVRAYLADDEGAVQAYRKFASLDIPADDAVEVELYVMALSALPAPAGIDVLQLTATINDFELLHAQLLADRRLAEIKGGLAGMSDEGEPPPRGAFMILDRDAVEDAGELSRENIPNVIGDLLLFGKETDREARLELFVKRTNLDAAAATLAESAGSLAGPPQDEKIVGTLTQSEDALVWRWHLPATVPPAVLERLGEEEYRHRLLHVWPETTSAHTEGKTFAEAAREPHLRRAVLASILDLEVNSGIKGRTFDFNELRTRLGLPALADVEPFRVDIENMSLLKLGRLPALLMPDEQLLMAFNLAAAMRADRAVERLGNALLERTTIDDENKRAVLLNLLRVTAGTCRALDYIRQGKAASAAAGLSPAPWLIEELALELRYGLSGSESGRRVEALIQEITRHRKEPGVFQQLTRVLAAFGLIDPAMMHQMAERQTSLSVAGMELKPHAPSFSPEAQIAAAAAAASEKKSGLWLPGMD